MKCVHSTILTTRCSGISNAVTNSLLIYWQIFPWKFFSGFWLYCPPVRSPSSSVGSQTGLEKNRTFGLLRFLGCKKPLKPSFFRSHFQPWSQVLFIGRLCDERWVSFDSWTVTIGRLAYGMRHALALPMTATTTKAIIKRELHWVTLVLSWSYGLYCCILYAAVAQRECLKCRN